MPAGGMECNLSHWEEVCAARATRSRFRKDGTAEPGQKRFHSHGTFKKFNTQEGEWLSEFRQNIRSRVWQRGVGLYSLVGIGFLEMGFREDGAQIE